MYVNDHHYFHSYSNLLLANNITGETLLECDQSVLKEMGVSKVGDRVRIFVAVKALRNKAYGNARKRNRVNIYTHMEKWLHMDHNANMEYVGHHCFIGPVDE